MIYLSKIKINKYSTFELKIGIDMIIEIYLNLKLFDENLKLHTLKTILIVLTIISTGLALLFSKPFPDNYNILLSLIICYILFRLTYTFIENKLVKTIFYIGTNIEYCSKLKKNPRYTIKEVKFHSSIDENNPYIYLIWFDFVTLEGDKLFTSKKRKIDCTKVVDERGYIHREKVIHSFKSIFKKEIKKIE